MSTHSDDEETPPDIQVTEHADGTVSFIRRIPTPEDLDWYRAKVAEHPSDPEPAYELAVALGMAGDREAALAEWRRTVALAPGDRHYRSALAASLAEAGDAAGAIREYRTALELLADEDEEDDGPDEQGEALIRWGLSKALADLGDPVSGRAELERAVNLMERGVALDRASPMLLSQMLQELA